SGCGANLKTIAIMNSDGGRSMAQPSNASLRGKIMITHSKKQLVCMISALSAGMLLAPQFAAAQQASGATLEEVIVTAQKRDENVQDVPITIAAITPGQLEAAGFNSVNDLQALVPALRIDYAGAFSQPTVRGVGSSI